MDKHLQADGCIHTEIFAVASFNVYLPVRPSVCLSFRQPKKIQIMYWNENSKKSNWLKLQNFIWLLFIFCFRLFLSNGWEVSSAIFFFGSVAKKAFIVVWFLFCLSVFIDEEIIYFLFRSETFLISPQKRQNCDFRLANKQVKYYAKSSQIYQGKHEERLKRTYFSL